MESKSTYLSSEVVLLNEENNEETMCKVILSDLFYYIRSMHAI